MKANVIILISLFVTITKAQVGINTTTPNASLEIRSENQANPSNTEGILIPKIDAFPATNPTVAQQGMMVYLTTTSGSNVPGFYYWDNTSVTWKPVGNEQDRDFLKVGTSEASTNILDNKYTFGNNGFGTTTPTRRLHVSNGVSGATSSGSTGILLESNANVYQHFLTPSTAENGLLFGTDTNSLGSGIIYNNVSNPDGFQFRAGGNFTRMTLTNTGNLGIGTVAPARRLHVANGVSGATSSGSTGILLESNTNVYQHFLTPSTAENGLLFGTDTGSIGASLIFNNTSTLNGFQFRTGGNFTRMTLTNNGNLGIGTVNPLDRLHIVGNLRMVDGNQAPGRVLTSDINGSATWQNVSANAWGLTGNGGTDATTNFIGTTDNVDLVFKTNNIEMFRIKNDGRIEAGNNGINHLYMNSFNPLEPKFILASENTNNNVYFQTTNDSTDGVSLYFSKARGNNSTPLIVQNDDELGRIFFHGYTGTRFATAGSIFSKIDGNVSSTSMPGMIQFFTTPANSLIQRSRMTIRSTGFVGIGTENPSSMLHVEGSIRMVDGNEALGRVLTSNANGTASWQNASANAWGITGNTGMNPITNFIGTSDNQSVAFRTNDIERMRLDLNGNLGLGLTTPSERLHVAGKTLLTNGFSTDNAALLYQNDTDYMFLGPQSGSSTNGAAVALFGSTNASGGNAGGLDINVQNGLVRMNHTNGNFTFGTNSTSGYTGAFELNDNGLEIGHNSAIRAIIFNPSNTERMRLTPTGNLGVGTNNPAQKVHVSGPAGLTAVRIGNTSGTGSTSNVALDFFRNTDANTDWRIYNIGPNLTIGNSGDDLATVNDLFQFQGSRFMPMTDATISLGQTANRWNTLFASNGTINTSDAREKKNIQNIKYGLNSLMQLRPVSFQWKKEDGSGTKLGLIAQELQGVIPEVVRDWDWIEDEQGNRKKVASSILGVYYSDLIPVLIKATQEQQEIIINQQQEINQLKSQLSTIQQQILQRLELLEQK